MANKRIELEQYKHYFDILAEEPNRKTWRRGIEIAFIAAALLVLALFVLGMMSGSLATNANNVLEKPPAKTTTTPEFDSNRDRGPIYPHAAKGTTHESNSKSAVARQHGALLS
jgi:hypothetical protein